MHMEEPTEHFRQIVRDSVKESGMGLRRFEAAHNLRPWALHGLLDSVRKQKPSLDRAAEICRALGLEFYIGPPRGEAGAEPPYLPAVSPKKRFKAFSPKIDLPV